jgi:hypothetical protein
MWSGAVFFTQVLRRASDFCTENGDIIPADIEIANIGVPFTVLVLQTFRYVYAMSKV